MLEKVYKPKNKIRIVTAASLFDGHDAAINIMRRIIQSTGCEVIHLGHDRSVEEVVNCAIQEDVNASVLRVVIWVCCVWSRCFCCLFFATCLSDPVSL